jgi:hypothetical protein
MEARRRIEGASFGPATVKVIGQAFDEAWKQIEGNFGTGFDSDQARLRLAEALLSVADDSSRDVEALKAAALKILQSS